MKEMVDKMRIGNLCQMFGFLSLVEKCQSVDLKNFIRLSEKDRVGVFFKFKDS